MKKIRSEIIWIIALIVVGSVIWCINRDRLSATAWETPTDYGTDTHGGDSLSALAWIKASSEWDHVPFRTKLVDRLGAPYIANWNDYPMGEEIPIFLMGVLASFLGVFTASNVALLLEHLTAALSFYACCRLFRFPKVWSWVGALLFGFTYYNSFRGLSHMFISYSYTIPPAILTCWIIAFSKRIEWGNKLCWFCLAVSLILGLSNPYFLNMFAQMLCLGLGLQILASRRKANIQIGFGCLAVAVVGFLAINLDTFSYQWAHGKNPVAMSRGYYETELFALKPIEFFLPPLTHNVSALRDMASKYAREAWIKGEMFSPYLGVVAISGLIWMFLEAIMTLLRPKKLKGGRKRFPAYVPLVLWVVFYSVVGGLNCMIALASSPLFRGSNRYSIFVSAFVLLFLVSRASLLTRGWNSEKKFVVAAAILIIGLFDQLPQTTPREETQAIAQAIQTDRSFVQAMEAKLPAKTMVFQLPVMPFPESTPVNNQQPYEHLRPYLFSKTLRFSFGSEKGRPREDWQKDVEKLPPQEMVNTLEKYGFGAVYLNRKGFPDQAEALIKQLAAVGRNQSIEDDARGQVCIVLNPSATPALPPPGAQVPLIFGRGWGQTSPSQAGVQHWAGGNASVSFFNPLDLSTMSYSLNCQVASLTPRRLSVHLNGREVWSAELGASQLAPVNVRIDAKPGNNRLEFKTDVVDRPSIRNPVPRAFVVINPQVLQAR